MDMEGLLIQLMELVEKGKELRPGPLARYYAIMNTELEKIYAFYMMYLYPIETDANISGDQEGE